MKKLLLSAALAAVIATPALAQSYNPEYGSANLNPPVAGEQFRGQDANAYAYAPRHANWSRQDARSPRFERQDVQTQQQLRDENY